MEEEGKSDRVRGEGKDEAVEGDGHEEKGRSGLILLFILVAR